MDSQKVELRYFDELTYLASYGDLLAAFGSDIAATQHFINHGYSEGDLKITLMPQLHSWLR